MANTTGTRKRSTRRGPTPARIKRAASRRFFWHLRALLVLVVVLFGSISIHGFLSSVTGFVVLLFVVNAGLGAVNLVQWRGWIK